MIKEIQKQLEPLLAAHGSVGLFLSGGSDSLLLLHILLDMKATFSCVAFDYSFDRKQREVIDALSQQFDLRIFTYRPSALYLIGDGKHVTLVEEYMFPSGAPVPFLRDCRQNNEKCIHDEDFSEALQHGVPIGFTLNLFGTRKTDRHYSVGKIKRAQTTEDGPITFYAPLWDLTRADVRRELQAFGEKMPKIDTGTIDMCLKCLTATQPVRCPRTQEFIDPLEWSPNAMLGAFRAKYGVV